MSNTYIHYGHKEFDKELFQQIKNTRYGSTKPYGGFWASAMDAKYGWKQWCDEAEFGPCDPEISFQFTLKEDAKVIHLHKVEEIRDLPQLEYDEFQYPYWVYIDFEECMKQGIDAIELHFSDDSGMYSILHSWDCDSILIMNPEIVKMV